MNSGIYAVINKVNGKVYIGKTKNFKRRFYQYEYDYRNQRVEHINNYLLASMNKHGFDNFEFKVVEYCSVEMCKERELFWMIEYQSLNKEKGYNLRSDSSSGMITHPDTSIKISNRLKLEWENGSRDSHGDKLKESWSRGDRDKSEQSERMSKNLTKYDYIVNDTTSLEVKSVKYKQLKELGLAGVLGKFAETKSDKVMFKGFNIERVRANDD